MLLQTQPHNVMPSTTEHAGMENTPATGLCLWECCALLPEVLPSPVHQLGQTPRCSGSCASPWRHWAVPMEQEWEERPRGSASHVSVRFVIHNHLPGVFVMELESTVGRHSQCTLHKVRGSAWFNWRLCILFP